MEIILIVLIFIIEIAAEVVLQIFMSLGFESVVKSLKGSKDISKYLAFSGLAIFGGLFGLFSFFIYPHRIMNNPLFPGVSLVISPIIVGYIMYTFGKMRVESGKETSYLSTFRGGLIFAFAYALIRFLLIS